MGIYLLINFVKVNISKGCPDIFQKVLYQRNKSFKTLIDFDLDDIKYSLQTRKMMRAILLSVLLFGVIFSSPVVPEAEEQPGADRGLVEDLITGMVNQQIYNILSGLGIVPTTTTTCGPLGLLCGQNFGIFFY